MSQAPATSTAAKPAAPKPVRSDFRLQHRLRVRWAEVDRQKIVFNGHYLMYFDTAMADYWRQLSVPYEALVAELKADSFVVKASLEYHASAIYDDMLDVCLKCARLGTSSYTVQGAIFRGDTLLVTGELVYVYADAAEQKSRPMPEAFKALFTHYEAGGCNHNVQVGGWQQLQEPASAVRFEVFVNEQGIDSSIELDEMDEVSVHAVVRNTFGQNLATGRLLPSVNGSAKIGRMAVVRPLRGSGLGAEVLKALEHAARERRDEALELSAQVSAMGFYARLGYVPVAGVYEEVGIAHQKMRKVL